MIERVRPKIEEPTGTDVAVRGAPKKYDPKFPKTAKFLAQRGATLAEIADCFEVSTRTLSNWLNQYPELREAIDVGNDVSNPRVERALAERAMGFWVDMEEVKITKDGDEVRYNVRKYFPPDVTACIFWLKNRLPEKWRAVPEHCHTGELRSSEDWLKDVRSDILELHAEGHITGLLPAPVKRGRRP
jgi:transposase-like protein